MNRRGNAIYRLKKKGKHKRRRIGLDAKKRNEKEKLRKRRRLGLRKRPYRNQDKPLDATKTQPCRARLKIHL